MRRGNAFHLRVRISSGSQEIREMRITISGEFGQKVCGSRTSNLRAYADARSHLGRQAMNKDVKWPNGIARHFHVRNAGDRGTSHPESPAASEKRRIAANPAFLSSPAHPNPFFSNYPD
jgi:hypothetical protein